MRGIGEDALPRMESVRAFRRERLFRLTARAGFGLRTLGRQKRQIVDGARPSEFCVIQRRVVARRSGELRERHDEENEMPQSSGDQRAARKSPFHPAVLEDSANSEIVWTSCSADEGCDPG